MKIAVITPYYKESIDVLQMCHQSVLSQNVNVDHFMVSDGFPNPVVDTWNVRHVKLPNAHGDNGNTPRAIGGMLAQSAGYDFVAYLDADNWFHLNHLQSLLDLFEKTRSNILTSFRTFHTLDGVDLCISEPSEINLLHVDTSCLMLHKSAFELLPLWMQMNKVLGPICDRIFLAAIKHKKYTFQSSRLCTVAFRSQYSFHYRLAKVDVPPGLKSSEEFKNSYDYLQSFVGIQECLDGIGFWPLLYMIKKKIT